MSLLHEFSEFLREYKVLALAIAFIIGAALTALVQSLVADIVMPVITPFIPGGGWKESTLSLGPVLLKWGSFLAAIINFVIIASWCSCSPKWWQKKMRQPRSDVSGVPQLSSEENHASPALLLATFGFRSTALTRWKFCRISL